jgi:hypothetical protein
MAKKSKTSRPAWYTNQPGSKSGKKRAAATTASKPMNTLRRIPSNFLTGSPSFASGVARLVDFGCAFDAYNQSATPQEADFRATLADWINAGFDIADAVEFFEQQRKIA